MRTKTTTRQILLFLGIAAGYFGSARLGLAFASYPEQISAVWPPAGIALAVFMLFGNRVWPAIALGAFAANALANERLWVAAVIAAGNTLAGLFGAELLRRSGLRLNMSRVSDVMRVTLLAGLLSPVLAASIGVFALSFNAQPPLNPAGAWFLWWGGDAMGVIIVAPLLFTWMSDSAEEPRLSLEAAAALLLTAVVSLLIFSFGYISGMQMKFLIFPLVMWSAYRLGHRVTALGVCIVSIVAIWAMVHDPQRVGPAENNARLLMIQMFVGVLSLSALTLSAIAGERRQALRELQASGQQLQAIIDNSTAIVYLKDLAGRYLLVNHKWEQTNNLQRKDVVGRSGFEIYPREVAEALAANDRAVIASREALQSEEEVPHSTGARTYISNKFLLFDGSGRPYALCGISTDISDRKSMEERQRADKEHAEAANRAKDEFLAIVSHELRTPLTPIIGWCHMLLAKPMDEPTRLKGLKAIERNAKAQSKLIEDLLDISRIVTGKIKLDCKAVYLAQVVGAAIEAVRPMAEAKAVRLELAVEGAQEEPPMLLWGDPNRLQQVVWNLLTNAVKFTPKNGRVDVRVQRHGDKARIVVSDTGEGIAPEYLPRMFERFSQFDYSTTRKHGGLGIGLSVVRQIVELHGGHAFAESAGLGKGATITVELPIPERLPGNAFPRRPREGSTPIDANTLQGKVILVVDDESDAREFFKEALSGYGANVLTAASAGEALEKLQSGHPDLLVSDIGMPGDDGYALIRTIRSRSIDIPAIAVTAFARSEDASRALQEGFQRHLSKPVEPEELCSALAELSE